MTKTSQYIERVLHYLNKEVEYALLRNYEGLPHHNTSRDMDIIITRSEFKKREHDIIDVLTQDDWRLFSYLNNGRLITFVCAKIIKGDFAIIQWDFFMDSSVHGIQLLSAKDMIQSRQFNGVLYHVSKDYEFLDKYLYNRAVNAPYPEKYKTTKEAAQNSEVVKQHLRRAFGCADIDCIDQLSGRSLLVRAFLNNFLHSPILSVTRVMVSFWLYFLSYLKSDVAPQLAFTGADGAGKTTLISLIEKKLSAVYGKVTVYFHFRPLLIPNLGEAAHSAGLKKDVDRKYDNPHRSKKRGRINSFIRLCYYSLDYILGYWIKVKPHARITKIIIFDRYYNDIIVDSRRSSIWLNIKFLYYWGKLFIPKMKYNFLITANSDIILSRKQELNKEGIETINTKMEYLSDKNDYYLIKNNGTAEEAVFKILEIILKKQHQQNIEKIK